MTGGKETRTMLILLPLLLLALCLWRMGVVKPLFSQLNTDYLSVDRTTSLRAVLALMVIFGHLALRTDGGGLFSQFSRLGYLAVAVFFFLTGYGLQKQYMTRRNYAKGFLRKRLLAVGLPYAVVTALYWSYYATQGRVYSLTQIIMAIGAGSSIVPYSWYIVEVLVFYVVFRLLMGLCRKRHGAMVLGGAVWLAAWTVFCVVMKYGSWWYISSLPVVVGMAWAVYEERIIAFLRKYYVPVFIGVLICLGVLLLLPDRAFAFSWMEDTAKMAITTLFAVAVVLLMLKIRLGNPVLHYLGQISMELYLLQGLAMMLLRSKWLYITNDLLYCLCVLAADVIMAGILSIALKGMPKKKPTR